MDHIEKFEDLASSIKLNGISEYYIYCKLCSYSLFSGCSLLAQTLTARIFDFREDTKKAFLNNVINDARSQGPTEAFKTSWDHSLQERFHTMVLMKFRCWVFSLEA